MNDYGRRRSALTSAQRLMMAAAVMAEAVDGQTAFDRMRANEADLRATRYDSTRPKVSTISDPTSTARIDRSTLDLRRLDRALDRIEAGVVLIEHVLDSWGPARLATELDRLALARLNITPEPGCANCARLEGPRGGVRWEPVDMAHPNATTVGGRLAEPMQLCAWCYDATTKWGRVPSVNELERHHRGERVPWPADVPRPE